jgi:hypothetical protein
MNTRALVLNATLPLCIAALGAVAVLTAAARPASAGVSADPDGFVCSNATLHGNYGFTVTGLRPTPLPPPQVGTVQVAIVGTALTNFHGDGTFDQFDNINVNSNPPTYTPDRPGFGIYTLNPDCSGTMSLTAGTKTLDLAIVVVDHGREVRTAVVTGGVIVTSNGRKM